MPTRPLPLAAALAALALLPSAPRAEELDPVRPPPPPPPPAAAQVAPQGAAPRPVGFEFAMTYDLGGEELLTVHMSDGSNQTLSANQGFGFHVGLGFFRLQAGAAAFDTAATIGVKGWEAGSDTDRVSYLVFPFELVERAWLGQVRLGAGLSYLLGPRLSGKGSMSGLSVDLSDSAGVVVQADWTGERRPGRPGAAYGLRYVSQRLRSSGGSGSVDASSIGFRLGFDF